MSPRQRKSLGILIFAFVCCLFFLNTLSAQQKNEIPTDDEAAESSELVREIYEEQYRKAATREAKSELAQEILDASQTEKDSIAKYVMLRLARNIAINAGDVNLTLDTLDTMAEEFAVDAFADKVSSFSRLCGKVQSSATNEMIDAVAEICDLAIEQDKYESVKELLNQTYVLAGKSRDSDLREMASELREQMRIMAEVYAEVGPFIEKLKTDPDDGDANLVVGKYYCFVKANWKSGLSCLAKCGVSGIEAVAQAELKSSGSGEERLKIADQWWELAEKQEEEDDEILMKMRAGFHYKFAATKTSGLAKAKAEKRAATAAKYGELEVADAGSGSGAAGKSTSRTATLGPVQLSESVVNYMLPAAFDDVVVGASGRYLIFHLNTLTKLAFFDVMAGKVTEYVELEGNDLRYTAGADSFYIAYRDKNTLERWSFKNFKKQLTVKVPFENPIDMVIMGAGSKGPVFIGAKHSPGIFISGKSMTPLNYQVIDHRYNRNDATVYGAGPESRMRASFNGQTFTNWATNVSPAGFRSIVFTGRLVHCFSQHDTMGYLMPSPDGELIHTGKGIYTMQTKPFSGNDKMFSKSFSIPAVHGNYSIRVLRDDDKKANANSKTSVTVHVNGSIDPLVTLNNIRIRSGEYGDFFSREKVALDKRVFFVPACNLLITLPTSNQSVVMHQVDLDEEFDKAGIDYLFVVSRPVTSIAAGKQYRYTIESRSKNGGVKYKLESGPKGMKVSSKGIVTWRASRNDIGKNHDVIVTVTDSKDRKVTHTFKIAVE